MKGDLPDGVQSRDIPGNRPKDEEIEITIVLCVGELAELRQCALLNRALVVPSAKRIVADIFGQVIG